MNRKSDFLGGIDFSSEKKPAIQTDFLSHLVDHDQLMTIEETANDYTSKPVTDTRLEPQLSSYGTLLMTNSPPYQLLLLKKLDKRNSIGREIKQQEQESRSLRKKSS